MTEEARAAIEQLRRESGDPYAYVMASKWGPGGAKWLACWHVGPLVRSAIAETEAGAALAGVEAIWVQRKAADVRGDQLVAGENA